MKADCLNGLDIRLEQDGIVHRANGLRGCINPLAALAGLQRIGLHF